MKASEYKKHLQKNTSNTLDVTMPSGFVWKLRPFPIQQYYLAGRLPTFFTSLMMQVVKQKGSAPSADEIGKSLVNLPEDEFRKTMDFVLTMIEYCAVEPRIVAEPKSDDEIAPEEIDPKDFKFLQTWCISGGASTGSNSFRSE